MYVCVGSGRMCVLNGIEKKAPCLVKIGVYSFFLIVSVNVFYFPLNFPIGISTREGGSGGLPVFTCVCVRVCVCVIRGSSGGGRLCKREGAPAQHCHCPG